MQLLGIRHVVLAVNKMDLVDYDQDAFDAIVADYRASPSSIGIDDCHAIPVSALSGDNVVGRAARMPWYDGPTLLEHLETRRDRRRADAARAVPHAGAVGQPPEPGFSRLRRADRLGPVKSGDEVRVLPSGRPHASSASSVPAVTSTKRWPASR